MSYINQDDPRWTDNAPECPYCGARVKSSVSRECANCASGREPVKDQAAERAWAPRSGSSYYPLTPMTPDELAAWKAKCDAFDAEVRAQSEPIPEKEIEEAEYAAYSGRK